MRIGIIGAGYAGQVHSNVIERFYPEIEYYIYDVATNEAKEFAKTHKCQAIATVEELYDKVDAIIIATPTFTHYSLAMEAMGKGKHVLCEKPMSLRLTEAEEMFKKSKEKNLICMVGFNYRFFEITKIIKTQCQIGKIQHIKVLLKRLFRDEWHNKENGVLSDLGIHLIDYVTYLCNQSINLSTCKIKRRYIEDWDYDANVLGEMENGISFELTASRIKEIEEVQFSIEVVGEKGIFRYDSRQETKYEIEMNKIVNTYNFQKAEITDDFFDFTDSIGRQDNAWIIAISGQNSKNIATFEDGFRAQKTLEYFLSKN